MIIECLHCNTQITHNPRQLTGCNCDPDAPQWCYIDTGGIIRGNSQASMKLVANQ